MLAASSPPSPSFHWRSYFENYPELLQPPEALEYNEQAAWQHYNHTGRAQHRVASPLRLRFRYTGANASPGLTNQLLAHLSAFMIAQAAGAEVVVAPFVSRRAFTEPAEWLWQPAESVLDINSMAEYWRPRGLVIHRVRCPGCAACYAPPWLRALLPACLSLCEEVPAQVHTCQQRCCCTQPAARVCCCCREPTALLYELLLAAAPPLPPPAHAHTHTSPHTHPPPHLPHTHKPPHPSPTHTTTTIIITHTPCCRPLSSAPLKEPTTPSCWNVTTLPQPCMATRAAPQQSCRLSSRSCRRWRSARGGQRSLSQRRS